MAYGTDPLTPISARARWAAWSSKTLGMTRRLAAVAACDLLTLAVGACPASSGSDRGSLSHGKEIVRTDGAVQEPQSAAVGAISRTLFGALPDYGAISREVHLRCVSHRAGVRQRSR